MNVIFATYMESFLGYNIITGQVFVNPTIQIPKMEITQWRIKGEQHARMGKHVFHETPVD